MKDDIARQERSSLASLIGSRICHDLINPIGAISNGLELVTMVAPDISGPEMTLIQQSCENAKARIRFFRIAFGSAADMRPVPCTEVRKTLADHYGGTRITPVWTLEHDLPRSRVQLGFLATMCLETALKQGGSIKIESGGTSLAVSAHGPSVVRDGPLWHHLTGSHDADLQPAEVQFGLLRALSTIAAADLRVSFSEDRAKIEIGLHGDDAA